MLSVEYLEWCDQEGRNPHDPDSLWLWKHEHYNPDAALEEAQIRAYELRMERNAREQELSEP